MPDNDDSYPTKPVEEGETTVLNIEDIGSKGDGIARVDGFIVFVPDTEVSETVKAEITSVGRKFAFAEVQERGVEPEGEKQEVKEEPKEPEEESSDLETEEIDSEDIEEEL